MLFVYHAASLYFELEVNNRIELVVWFPQISVYAAYLYDAVQLYARALDEVTKTIGISGATHGSEIFNHIKGRSYMSKLCLMFVERRGRCFWSNDLWSGVSIGWFIHCSSVRWLRGEQIIPMRYALGCHEGYLLWSVLKQLYLSVSQFTVHLDGILVHHWLLRNCVGTHMLLGRWRHIRANEIAGRVGL